MKDDSSEEENLDGNLGLDVGGKTKKKAKKQNLNQSHDKLEVNLDDIPDDDY